MNLLGVPERVSVEPLAAPVHPADHGGQALSVLDGEAVAGPLLDFYQPATDLMLLIRGKLRLGDVYDDLDGPRSGELSPRLARRRAAGTA